MNLQNVIYLSLSFFFHFSLQTHLDHVVRVVLVLLIVQRSADGFVCEKDVDHCHISLIINTAFTMIDPSIGPVFVNNGTLYPVTQPKYQVPIEDVITADG